MSVSAILAVLQHSKTKGADQTILLRVAYHIDDRKHTYTWTSLRTIAEESGYGYQHVNRRVLAMEKMGELIIVRKAGFSHHLYIGVWKGPSPVQTPGTVPGTPVDGGGVKHCTGEVLSSVPGTIRKYKENEIKKETESASLRESEVPPFNGGMRSDQEGTGAVQPTNPNRPDVKKAMPNPDDKERGCGGIRITMYTEPLGPWFDEINQLYPNQGKADRARAETIVRKMRLNADGPLILTAMQNLIRDDPQWSDGGPFLPRMSAWIEGGAYRNVRPKPKPVRKLQY